MNNKIKIVLSIVIVAVLVIVIIIGAVSLADRMNDVVSPFSNVERPVSVLEAQFSDK